MGRVVGGKFNTGLKARSGRFFRLRLQNDSVGVRRSFALAQDDRVVCRGFFSPKGLQNGVCVRRDSSPSAQNDVDLHSLCHSEGVSLKNLPVIKLITFIFIFSLRTDY